jgi:hypothetical protein
VFVLVLLADVLELAGDLVVIDLDPARGIFRYEIDPDHRAGEILGDEAADDARFFDVRLDRGELFRRGLEAFDVRRERRRDHVAAGESVFDDFDEAHVRREDRADARFVDMLDRLRILGDVLHGLEERLVEHVAALVHHRDQNAVGAAEVLLVVEKRLHVLVLQRNHLLEAGVDAQLQASTPRTP